MTAWRRAQATPGRPRVRLTRTVTQRKVTVSNSELASDPLTLEACAPAAD